MLTMAHGGAEAFSERSVKPSWAAEHAEQLENSQTQNNVKRNQAQYWQVRHAACRW